MNKHRREIDFKRGAKTSSSLMATDSPEQVQQFMETSFYLPVDVLKNRDWQVFSINVISGKRFSEKFYKDEPNLRCVEDYDLLCAAQFVAISTRRNLKTRTYYYVVKLWYGEAP